MKIKTLLFVFVSLCISTSLFAQDEDIIVIPTTSGGLLESTINGDTTDTGERINPNRIYELEAGGVYQQHGPINVENIGGTVTIRGQEGGKKAIIIMAPVQEVNIGINHVRGSLTIQNVQYHAMELDGNLSFINWNIQGEGSHLTVDNSLIENCSGITFNCTGVPSGAEIRIRNSYFRDMFNASQWWGGRVVEAKVPVDTFIFENNTVTGGGLTVLGQECLFDYSVINHNTFINNVKYPFLNQYWKEVYFTNNLFVNTNMVGEDMENVASGGQDPDALLLGISGVDTIENSIAIQPRFLNEDSTLTEEVDGLDDIIYYAADNVVVYSSELDDYYGGAYNDVGDYPVSYLTWGGAEGPFQVLNVPGIWANERTMALVEAYDNIKDENNSIYEMTEAEIGFVTEILSQQAADTFIQWNRNQWGVAGVSKPTTFTTSGFYFGDFVPTTAPGIEVENAPSGQAGITKISDMVEDFTYTANLVSQSDGLKIGALHWWDEEFDAEVSLAKVKAAYSGEPYVGIEDITASDLKLKNYPNPFSSSTTISFDVPERSHVTLSIYDISGKMVETLVDENKGNGSYSVEFIPEKAINGVYFCKLETADVVKVIKLTFLK